MSRKLRQQVSLYLPAERAVHYQEQAAREGVSLSAYLARALTIEARFNDLLEWLTARFERLEMQLRQTSPMVSSEALLALTGLDQLPRETLFAILQDLKEEINSMTDKQREHYAAKGRELLAKMNGGAK